MRNDLYKAYPQELVDALLGSYIIIKEHFYLGRFESAELNGGKFVEACVRILQYSSSGSYTPIGQEIKNMIDTLRKFEQLAATSCLESYRIHIPRNLMAIYNIRNKRGVGHLGGDVNPNMADSILITSVCDWVLAELFSINFNSTLDEAQNTVDSLVQRKIPLVYSYNGVTRVLNQKLSLKNQTLLLLAEYYPKRVLERELVRCLEPSNVSYYRREVIKPLHKERLIDYSLNEGCFILPGGLKIVENNLIQWKI